MTNTSDRERDTTSPHPIARSNEHLTYQIFRQPGGTGSLQLAQDKLIAEDGRTYPITSGIVRMLTDIDAGLAAELKAQRSALEIYLNDHYLLTRYERTLATIAVEKLLGTIHGPILDAGCGVGMIGKFYPDLDLYGLDASFPLLEQANVGYRVLIESSVDELPFADESFEAILALNVFHHLLNPTLALQEFARVLRPGGVLVALDPRRIGFIELAKRILRRGDPAYAETHKAFGSTEYVDLLTGSGVFRLETFTRFGFTALLAAGTLDQLGISARASSAYRVLEALIGVDNLLVRMPLIRDAGLYLGVRATREHLRGTNTGEQNVPSTSSEHPAV